MFQSRRMGSSGVSRALSVAGAALFVLLASCSRKAEPEADGPDDPGIVLSERMTAVVEQARGDCSRMGADLKRFLDDNAAAVTSAKEAERTRSPFDRAVFAARHRARIDAISRRLLPALEPCVSNPAVASAMSALPAEPHQPVESDKDLPQ